jgi:hypothetical protein
MEPVLGILAGAGATPELAAKAAQAKGRRVVYVALSESGAKAPSYVDQALEISLFKVGSILEFLEQFDAKQILMVGKFDKGLHNLDWSQIDEVAGQMLQRMAGRSDMDIGKVVLEELESRGFEPVSQQDFFVDQVAPTGRVAGPKMDSGRMSEVDHGLGVARQIAQMDIGQTVVVREGLVVAVEAAEHSDSCIERAGSLVDGPLCVVKVARPKQDFRFDTPVVGVQTLVKMSEAKANLLVVEAGRCLILDQEFEPTAEKLGITVVGVSLDKE